MSKIKTGGFLIEHIINYCLMCENGGVKNERWNDSYVETVNETIGFIDEIPGGFLIYHADGGEEIVYANKALIKMFRCKNLQEFKDYTGNSFRGVVYKDDLELVEKSIAEQIADNQDKLDYVEYRILRRDGEIRWVDDYGHFIHSESVGDVFYVFISDITDEKKRRIRSIEKTAELVNEKEQKIQNLIEEYDKERKLINQEHLRRLEVIEGLSVNYESILYADLDSDKVLAYRMSERIRDSFPENANVCDYGVLIKKYAETWVIQEDKQTVLGALQPKQISEKLSSVDTYYINYRVSIENKIRHMQLRVVNVGGEKRVSQVVIGTRNIDEEIERGRKQTQVLEAALRDSRLANTAKNTFLSNMSHDMRTPLNAIFGYTALARNIADEATRAYLDKIDASGKQLLELIEKVLFISQIESDDKSVSAEKTNLKSLMNNVYNEACDKAVKKDISVTLNCSGIDHGFAYCDGAKLEQILSYITGNAVKYTQKGGKVDIVAAETNKLPNGYSVYEFTVNDNGIGISSEALESIFEPFNRERNTTASGVIGAGLGLTIAKRLAEAMGGSIGVTSTLGEGSSFTVTLNLQTVKEERGSEENISVLVAELTGKKILIVDDNEINMEIVTELLKELGFSVDTASDGDIAVEKIENSSAGEYGLILMDIQMPKMDGREATRIIRRLPDERLAQIPIIALSANAFDNDKQLSLASGMDAHLNKPLDVSVLIKTMATVLQSRSGK